jgi:pyruvate/2-oxoglutarate dehydrogenase complex dihydrolipoamide acyltransferase (E2) component
METFLIDVPVPSMGATVNELTVIDLLVAPGAKITKGQKIAEMESDKSIFDFEAPCDGTVVGVQGRAGDILPSGAPFLRIETADGSLKHLQVKESGVRSQESGKAARSVTPMTAAAPAPTPASGGLSGLRSPKSEIQWTPRATKLAQEAGLDPLRTSRPPVQADASPVTMLRVTSQGEVARNPKFPVPSPL